MKVEGIDITDEHIGKEVTHYDNNSNFIDCGTIYSYNDTFTSIKFEGNILSYNGTDCLYWDNRVNEFKLKDSIIEGLGLEDILTINNFTVKIDDSTSLFSSIDLYKGGEFFFSVKYLGNNVEYSLFHVTDEEKAKLRRKLKIDSLV